MVKTYCKAIVLTFKAYLLVCQCSDNSSQRKGSERQKAPGPDLDSVEDPWEAENITVLSWFLEKQDFSGKKKNK